MHTALSPVIGQRGVAALYKRTLHVARAAYPWLGDAYDEAFTPGDFTALRAALAGQESTAAAAAHDAMRQILCELLGNLIGPSLTNRLLPRAWHSPIAGSAVQDPSP